MKRLSNRTWIIIIAAFFLAMGVLALMQGRGGGTVAVISVDGREIRRIDLTAVTREAEFDLDTGRGVNTIAVRNGAVCVSFADCPDQVCVRRGWLTGGYTPIVCLPHRLVIELISGGDTGAPDAVAG